MWSRDLVANLIWEYRQHENLYNVNHPDYQNRVKRSNSLFQICERLKQDDEKITVGDIKIKWHCLRTQYVRETRKLEENAKRKANPEDALMPKLWCYQLLGFLKTHVISRQSSVKLCWNKQNKSEVIQQESLHEDNSTQSIPQEKYSFLNGSVCRICLQHNVILNWNEQVLELSGVSYKDCYYKYIKLEKNYSDCFPETLCEICACELKNAHLLFEKALESFRILSSQSPDKKYSDEISNDQTTSKFEVLTIDIDKCEMSSGNNSYTQEDLKLLEDDINISNISDNESLGAENTICTSAKISISKEPLHFIDIQRFELSEDDLSGEETVEKSGTEIKSVTIEIDKRRRRYKFLPDTLLEQQLNKNYNPELKTSKSSKTFGSLPEVLLEPNSNKSFDTKPLSNTAGKSKQKLFMCAYCSTWVGGITRLRQHEATHCENRKRTETCPQCGIKLYTKMALHNHMKIHDENRQKKYQCEFCEKAFFNRGGLNIHRRIHLGLMVTCPICSKEFYRQIDLNRHLPKHSATPLQNISQKLKYTVQCQYCNEYVRTDKWREHKAAHLGQPLYKCKICERDFFARSNCVKHIRRVHHKSKSVYEEFIHYYINSKERLSHLMIKQQEIVKPLE